MSGAAFLALAKNRYFLDADSALSLDAGGFVAARDFATGQQAVILGKPAPDFSSGVEIGQRPPPTAVAAGIVDAVDWILDHRATDR